MDQGDLERVAESAYETPGMPTKVARDKGIEVRWVPNLRVVACSGFSNGKFYILVRASLSFSQRQQAVGHEFQMPRRLFLVRAVEVEYSYERLALDFHVSQTSAALRLAETEGRDLAVVCPHRVYARGELQRRPETTLRTEARRGGPGVRTARLGDDRKRIVVEMESECVG